MLLLTFTAGVNRYAIDVTRVVELVPRVELRKIPHAPASLAGLLGFRGKVVPVIDLSVLLDSTPCRDCLSTRIILVNDTADDHNPLNHGRDDLPEGSAIGRARQERRLSLLGLIAEQVSDLTYTRPEQVVTAPVWLPQTPYLGAIVQTDQGIVQLIVVEKVREASLQAFHSGQDGALESKSESDR
jgi:chemotaxis-related protein WspB